MTLTIQRTHELQTYSVPMENATLLRMLNHVKTTIDPTLTYSHGCRSGVCGSCAVRVNGREQLSCTYKPSEGDVVEPLRSGRVIRDLVVDSSAIDRLNLSAHAWSESSTDVNVSPADAEAIETQSECILCSSCLSACPVAAINPEFLGPFALTRVWRYVNDVRENDSGIKIATIQTNGIWDCTLCGECVPVCPMGIAPAQDIRMLRSKSGMMGYMDPSMSFGGMDFGAPMF